MIQALADNPVALIEQGAPHRTHTEGQLTQYTQALFRLTAKDRPTSAEQETIDLLALLIEDFESQFCLPEADPITVLKHLMKAGGLLQQDLRPELGTTSNISMILAGQRGITLANASALAARFGVDIRTFLPIVARANQIDVKARSARE